MVIYGTIDTAIIDSGATSSCSQEAVSERGRYQPTTDPLISTENTPNKMFQYAGGSIGRAKELKHLPYDVRNKNKIHSVPETQHHLISTNKFAEKYVYAFDKDQVNVHDTNDIKIHTTRGAMDWGTFQKLLRAFCEEVELLRK